MLRSVRVPGFFALAALCGAVLTCSCSAGSNDTNVGSGGTGGTAGDAGFDAIVNDAPTEGSGGSDACPWTCSDDYRGIVGCDDEVITVCSTTQMCANGECRPACEAADTIRSSIGCEYFPVMMEGYQNSDNGCFAVFVANSWPTAAHLSVDFKGATLDPAQFGYLPNGSGKKLTYEPYNATDGIPPGQVAILFLAGPGPTGGGGADCPENPAITNGSAQVDGTGKGNAFHVVSDVPVVAYQILPYGGGNAAVTGATLLMPSGVWDTNYIAVNAFREAKISTRPSMNIVALQDDTEVKMVPGVKVLTGSGVPATDANSVLTIQLGRGQQVQITQPEELTGSPIESNKPIAVMAGHECMQVPVDRGNCDHAEQQIPPVRAMGYEYVGAPFRQRSSVAEAVGYRIIGAVDGTQLTFDPPSVHAAVSANLGGVIELAAAQPFVVRSQDADHPFLVASYMTGSETVQTGYGDPDFVRLIPPRQYLQRYVFFTDPTYPETNLVVVREKGPEGFADVELLCAGVLDGWQPVGTDGRFEYTRFDLVRHDYEPQGNCDNGLNEMKSELPFGLTVWGWGTTETTWFSQNVSYGYPAGESVVQLNDIFVPSIPK